jgi:long-chain acyl-CoA synthetase
MNIVETIREENKQRNEKIALIDGERAFSYAELICAVDFAATELRAQGIERKTKVGLLCDGSIEYVILSLAILSLRAVVVPIAPSHTKREIDEIIERIDVEYLVAEPRLRSCSTSVPLHVVGYAGRAMAISARCPAKRPPAGFDLCDAAFIRFSSGTTGASKGVVLSHRAILERTDAADRGLRVTDSDRVLWMLSMSFHFVVTILLFLRRGAAIIICREHRPESLIEDIVRQRGSLIFGSPFHYKLLADSRALGHKALSGIRMAISTAMKLPDTVADEFFAKFGFELTEAYGIIEIGLPFVPAAGSARKRGSVGRPLPDYSIRIDDPDADGVGAILLRGPGMLDAYYCPWQERADILLDGWFSTGDLGRIDSDGDLFIVGRKNEVINFAGMKIFPQEVESLLNTHPMVSESQVYASPHPLYGQLPEAKIVSVAGATEAEPEELRRFCAEHLAQYKIPKRFTFVDELPRTPSGKIRRGLS